MIRERLDVRLERGALELSELVAVARLLAKHLDEVHARGETDGGIVPSRVELGEQTGPHLLPMTDEHRGQKAYTAPEAWSAPPTAASDQFALASVLYEALCGGRAFPGDDAQKIHDSITTGNRVPLAARVPGLAEAVDEVFTRALQVDPAARFPSCSSFVDALADTVERTTHSEVLVQKPSSRPASRRPPARFEAAEDAPLSLGKVAIALLLLALVAAALASLTK